MVVSLKGIFDLHVHTAPDIRERAYTDIDLMLAAIRVGARGIVIKSHHGTTMNRAYLVNEMNKMFNGLHADNEFVMYGSITMNKAIGGINPVAVETALKMGAKIVHLPTVSATNHLVKYKKDPREGVFCVHEGKLVPELMEVLELIRDNDVALATGHLSPQEILCLISQAKSMGIDRIIVTHPEFWVVNMGHTDQIHLAKEYGVYIERCFAQPMGGGVYKSNLADNLDVIQKIGHEHILISTDGGQIENPNWELAMMQYLEYLFDNGVTQEQIDVMTKSIPEYLLGLR